MIDWHFHSHIYTMYKIRLWRSVSSIVIWFRNKKVSKDMLLLRISFHLEDVWPRVQSHWGRLNLEIILWWGVMAVKIYDQTSACVGVLPPDGSRRQRTPMSCWTNSWGLYHPQQLPCWDCSDTDFPKSTYYLQSIKHIWWANKYNIAISCLNLFWGPI